MSWIVFRIGCSLGEQIEITLFVVSLFSPPTSACTVRHSFAGFTTRSQAICIERASQPPDASRGTLLPFNWTPNRNIYSFLQHAQIKHKFSKDGNALTLHCVIVCPSEVSFSTHFVSYFNNIHEQHSRQTHYLFYVIVTIFRVGTVRSGARCVELCSWVPCQSRARSRFVTLCFKLTT